VPIAERIATFDNNSTIWAELTMYLQPIFALDCANTLDPSRPE